MKKTLNCLALLLLAWATHAQSADLQVFASAGTASNQAAFTIGEPLTATLVGTSTTLTQGFHQSRLTIVGIDETAFEGNIKLFPNPTDRMLVIELEDINTPLSAYLYDMHGRLLLSAAPFSTRAEMSVEQLAAGTYLVVLETSERQVISRSKIVKH